MLKRIFLFSYMLLAFLSDIYFLVSESFDFLSPEESEERTMMTDDLPLSLNLTPIDDNERYESWFIVKNNHISSFCTPSIKLSTITKILPN